MPGGVSRRLRTSPATVNRASMVLRFLSIVDSGGLSDRFTDRLYRAAESLGESEWARLPAGPLERHLKGGEFQGGSREGVHRRTRKEVSTFLGRAKFEEASANY